MSNITQVINNAFTWSIQGEVDLSSAAAVVANRGDNMVVTKTGTGTYTIVVKNSGALQLVEIIRRSANYCITVPATATGCNISTVTQSTTTGDITINLNTTASPTFGALTDGTAATTIAFEVIIRIGRLVSPI